MKHLFIINPTAGKTDKREYVAQQAEKVFSGRDEEYELYITKAPMDACEKIRTEAASGQQLAVYACGGDGTLNECVCGAAGLPNVAVTHFPCGTGNDFIKTLGEGKEKFFDLSELLQGDIVPLDLIDCNGRYSLNICSVGIDARIGVDVHKYSSLPVIGGACGYVVSTAVNFFKGITNRLHVEACGLDLDDEMTLICACNGRFYGGGFNPVPTAIPNDGIIDFLVIKGISRLTFARLVGKYAKGLFRRYPQYITHLRGTEMTIDSREELVVQVDGECMRAKHIEFKMIPGGVNFIMPRGIGIFESSAEEIEAIKSKWEISVK